MKSKLRNRVLIGSLVSVIFVVIGAPAALMGSVTDGVCSIVKCEESEAMNPLSKMWPFNLTAGAGESPDFTVSDVKTIGAADVTLTVRGFLYAGGTLLRLEGLVTATDATAAVGFIELNIASELAELVGVGSGIRSTVTAEFWEPGEDETGGLLAAVANSNIITARIRSTYDGDSQDASVTVRIGA